ncbi:MAG: phosphofructokinase [Gammaproteobacteria bacterium]|jgi:6-phosphofructokinase 1|nr:phosphofructokinase [Gammaproteobacteria bacterium]
MAKQNIFYAQSGGVTAVINATACGLIEAARAHKKSFGKVLVGRNGILGALHEELIDTTLESKAQIRGLYHTPAGAFGSCRYKLKSLAEHKAEYERLIEVFAAHNIGYFMYNGGGDSQDTTHKVALMSQQMGYPLTCIGIPKTVDNDLPITDNCPGFGSVAKYVAVSIREAGLDVASMAATSTKVFIMEVMGRHAGWIAAAGGLAAEKEDQAPHIILFPEVALDEKAFLEKVEKSVKKYGFCAIVVSEGVRNRAGEFIASAGLKDAFGHTQLGGVAPVIAQLVKSKLGYKYHWAVCDYLQRAARHIASKTDVEQAYALGYKAIEFALEGKSGIMATIVRKAGKQYRWSIGTTPLEDVANQEKCLPKHFIRADGFGITQACRDYLTPLIAGEDYPPYKNGLPQYIRLKNELVPKKLKTKFQEKR